MAVSHLPMEHKAAAALNEMLSPPGVQAGHPESSQLFTKPEVGLTYNSNKSGKVLQEISCSQLKRIKAHTDDGEAAQHTRQQKMFCTIYLAVKFLVQITKVSCSCITVFVYILNKFKI